MEEGKLYKGVYNGVVVKCTTKENCNLFSGVVVKAANSNFEVGYEGDSWLCEAFEEYTPKKILVKNEIYDVPEGCKAEIKDNKIIIKDDIKYYKIECSDCTSYIREYLDKQLNIYIYKDGYTYVVTDVKIMVEGEKSTEQEFMDAYNKALNNFKIR